MSAGNRWEWRIFAPKLGSIPQAWLDAAEAAHLSDEEYLISVASQHNVKIRDGVLDIKKLLIRDTSGVEQWQPVLRREFPLDAEAIKTLWKMWGLPVPVARLNRCSHDELLEEVKGEPVLEAVRVAKKRARIRVGECDGEFTLLNIRGERWQTLAIESLDPDDVVIAVTELGFETTSNTNYPAALKTIIAAGAEETLITTEAK